MKSRLILCGALLAAVNVALMTGCEWSGGAGADSWSEEYNSVNFNGTYRGVGGGALVTDYTATPGTPGTTNTVSGEVIAVGNGSQTVFSAQLNNDSVRPGTVTVVAPGYNFTDNGGGTLTGTGGASGTINYNTGAITLDFNGAAPDAGNSIVATYQHTVAGTTGAGSAGPGSTGFTIFSFTVFHDGENLQITDNNGSVYEGSLGQPRATLQGTADSNGVTRLNGPVVAQFQASGVSRAGLEVNMVGSFQGTANDASLEDRVMFGTWIENGGRTGDINGQASPVTINN